MGVPRGILIAAVVVGGVILLLYSLQSSYLRFVGKDSAYYREFADACDLLLQQHPVGTNDWVYRHGLRSPENSVQIRVTDPSLPRIIRALGPEEVVLSSNRVFILVGVGRGAFGITWAQDSGPNGWSLRTCAENLEKTHYETTKLRF
jgi:hypothetical protein